MRILRSVVAVLAGLLVSAVLFQIAAAVVVLAVYGIPLGSEAAQTGAGTYAALLAAGGIAAWIGARASLRIARGRRFVHALVLAAVMALVVLAGFGKPASNWPGWFPWALAAMGVAGAALAARGGPETGVG